MGHDFLLTLLLMSGGGGGGLILSILSPIVKAIEKAKFWHFFSQISYLAWVSTDFVSPR